MSDDRHEGPIEELRPLLASALQDLDEADREGTLELLLPELERAPMPEEEARTRSVGPDLLGDDWYAVHDSDLELLKGAGGAVAAVLLSLAKPITAVGALVVLLYKYRKHRIRLSGEQGLVLRELKRAKARGLTFDELRYKADVAALPPETIAGVLEQLKSLPKENGELTSLVTFHDGRWRASDV